MFAHCLLCQAAYIPGMLLCEQCGAELLPLSGDAATQETASAEQPCSEYEVSLPGTYPVGLRVLILNSSRMTEWLDDQVIQIGRADHRIGVIPTLDLDAEGGQQAGVSRQHARLLHQPDGYYVEDLGSINGTFINRRRLTPGQPTEIYDRDEIRLGNMVLRVILRAGLANSYDHSVAGLY